MPASSAAHPVSQNGAAGKEERMETQRPVNRRRFLSCGAVLGAGAAWASLGWHASPALAQRKLKGPIKIGAQATLSGPFGGYGEYMRMGAQLAVDELNAAGGILGAPVEIAFRDEELKPTVAAANARYFVDTWGADVLTGIDASSSVLGVAEVMAELNRPLIVTHAATEKLNEIYVYQRGIKQIFRISVPVYQDGILAAMIAKDFPVKRWATIGADYEYGHTCWKFFKATLQRLRDDVQFVEESWAKFLTTDFGPHITKVMAANPDGIYSTQWAGEAVTLIKQAKLFGVFDKIQAWMTPMGAAMDVLEGLGAEYPEKCWVSSRYWFLYPPTQENRAFVERFHKRWGKYPHYVSETTYSAIYAYKAAVEKAGTTETAAVIKALEGMTVTTPGGRRYFRPEDHQAIYEVPWGRIMHDAKYPFPILTDLKVLPGELYYRQPPFEA
jgi:branched-chain amino acid transport system substrate-binding protein